MYSLYVAYDNENIVAKNLDFSNKNVIKFNIKIE